MIDYNKDHPITFALSCIAPVLGINFDIRSARDAELPRDRYPLIEYVIRQENRQSYDPTRKAWRVELVVQLDYLIEEVDMDACVQESELVESLAVQGAQYAMTSAIRAILQFLVNPSSIGRGYRDADFLWAKYNFKLENVPQSVYFRDKSKDKLTGASTLFVISLTDVDNIICCVEEDATLLNLLTPNSVGHRTLTQKLAK